MDASRAILCTTVKHKSSSHFSLLLSFLMAAAFPRPQSELMLGILTYLEEGVIATPRDSRHYLESSKAEVEVISVSVFY